MRRTLSRAYALSVIVISAWVYAGAAWPDSEKANQIALGLEGKPFVYRALVPWLALFLMKLGLAAEPALSIVIVLSAIGLFYGLQFLAKSIRH